MDIKVETVKIKIEEKNASCNQFDHIATSCLEKKNQKDKSVRNNAVQTSEIWSKSLIYKNILIEGQEITALIDTESAVNLVRSYYYFKIGAPKLNMNNVTLNGVGTDKNFRSTRGICSYR